MKIIVLLLAVFYFTSIWAQTCNNYYSCASCVTAACSWCKTTSNCFNWYSNTTYCAGNSVNYNSACPNYYKGPDVGMIIGLSVGAAVFFVLLAICICRSRYRYGARSYTQISYQTGGYQNRAGPPPLNPYQQAPYPSGYPPNPYGQVPVNPYGQVPVNPYGQVPVNPYNQAPGPYAPAPTVPGYSYPPPTTPASTTAPYYDVPPPSYGTQDNKH